MNATLFQKVELRFWDIFLPLLTKSQGLRKVVKSVVSFYHNDRMVRQAALVAMIACAGFASGILFFTISRIVG
ncbi:MAG: hypothetical protein AB9897_09270 [Anaerolineaceae bacterium]